MSQTSNARDAIARLLTTSTSPGKYSCGSELSCPVPSVVITGEKTGTIEEKFGLGNKKKKLSFPLSDKDVQNIKDNAQRAGVGLPDRTVVNLDVRKTWQIKPRNLEVTGAEPALRSALEIVSRELGTQCDYKIEANLYKLLLYEEGCFFAKHRDNERLDNMFATLVLELPSEYEGAELSVSSPLTPNEKCKYTFNGGSSSGAKRKTRSNRPGMHFAAFYADCYHEVSQLTTGHRVALVYHLTANPLKQNPLYAHLPTSPTPSQPADESVAIQLSKLMTVLANESEEDYPCTWEKKKYSYRNEDEDWPGKPQKLAIVLSHHYTPASFTGINALKGTDRSIAELVRAAAFCSSTDTKVPSLTRLAAKAVVEEGGDEYASAKEMPAHDIVSREFKTKDEGPLFDAVISLATVWDSGECTPQARYGEGESFATTGPLISITGEMLELGNPAQCDLVADYHPSWFGNQGHLGQPYEYEGPMDEMSGMPIYDWEGPIIYGEQVHQTWGGGNHTLPIYRHELLFASQETAAKFREESYDGKSVILENDPKEIEFLGNGMPYPGRKYSRAVLLIWPKAHRRDIQSQTKGGRAILKAKGDANKVDG